MSERRVFSKSHCVFYDPQPGGKYNCLKGVDIRAHVGGPNVGWLARTPCVTSKLSYDQVPCELREYPTQAEVDAFHADMDRRINQLIDGVCPDCGKALIVRETDSVAISACPDGHVSARACKRVGYR